MKNTRHAFSTPTISLFLAVGPQLLQAFKLRKPQCGQLPVDFFRWSNLAIIWCGTALCTTLSVLITSSWLLLTHEHSQVLRKKFETCPGSCNLFCQTTLIRQNPKKAIMLEEMPIAQILQMMQTLRPSSFYLFSLPVHHRISCLLSKINLLLQPLGNNCKPPSGSMETYPLHALLHVPCWPASSTCLHPLKNSPQRRQQITLMHFFVR